MDLTSGHLASLGRFVPELVVVLTMVALVLAEATHRGADRARPLTSWITATGLGVAAVLLALDREAPPAAIFAGALAIDPFGGFCKLVMTVGAGLAALLAAGSRELSFDVKPEFAILATGVLFGGMLTVSASNLPSLYIGVETMSILSFALASFNKRADLSAEAGLKYALYGGVCSGLMLFGMSHLYGVLGSMDYAGMGEAAAGLDARQALVLLPSFLLFFAGLGYKVACVPFHMWAPDVYEGSPTPVTAFFSVVPKIAGVAAIARISPVLFPEGGALGGAWGAFLVATAVLTMTVGNASAVGQPSMKRMLAFSSVSHSGMLLLGVAAGGPKGTSAVLFYAAVYLFMTLTAFWVTSRIHDMFGNDRLERFNGLARRHPLVAVLMALSLFSLAGVPPLGGFVAKFNILAAAVERGLYVPAVLAALNSVVALYYYLRPVRLMFLKEPEGDEPVPGLSPGNQWALASLGLPVVLLGVLWSGLYGAAASSVLAPAP